MRSLYPARLYRNSPDEHDVPVPVDTTAKLLNRLANINHATRRAIAGAREAISETPGAPRRCVI